MPFIADFHIHSRFSRATAGNLDLENIYISAQKKGIAVVATGDFTHPGWLGEIKAKLVPAEPGLHQLKKEVATACDRHVPQACRGEVRFLLAAEISNIYKKAAKTRKNHNLLFVPDLEAAERLSSRLDRVGNIRSDGRPILGLDARDMLEMLLDISRDGFLIPAHIWTPWFSVLGSKSGFDSIEACFEDLTPHIFALETGLSSDPAMNRRVSSLDRFTLVSNSDAHSPAKLGREANLLDTDLSYPAILSALKGEDAGGFMGTFEFYPEEGKYHADGHRACGVRLMPQDTLENGGICPVCAKALTLGVLHRVEQLADRPAGHLKKDAPAVYHLIPLDEVLGEIFGVGPGSKRVQGAHQTLLERIGPEFSILHSAEPAAIDRAGIPLLGEAIRRMRRGNIKLSPGYDGEFGKITIFSPHERQALTNQKLLFSQGESGGRRPSRSLGSDPAAVKIPDEKPKGSNKLTGNSPSPEATRPDLGRLSTREGSLEPSGGRLNPEQQAAVTHGGGPLLIIAGPGTGKTRTLTHRIAHLIRRQGVSPENILALTFTHKAAAEMSSRLTRLLGPDAPLPLVATFHGFCLHLLKSEHPWDCRVIDEAGRRTLLAEVLSHLDRSGGPAALSIDTVLKRMVAAKQWILGPDDALEAVCPAGEQGEFVAAYRLYQQWMGVERLCDYEDLIFKVVRLMEESPDAAQRCRKRFRHLFVDEYQDLNHGQYRILRALAAGPEADIFVIGDPDQSIYGFRGSDSACFTRFAEDFPTARTIRLTRNYRSTAAILGASGQVIRRARQRRDDIRVYGADGGERTVGFMELANERAEAVAVGKLIENLVGGLDFHALDAGQVENPGGVREKSFADIAVLFRTRDQGDILAQAFEQAGIPCQRASALRKCGSAGVDGLLALSRVVFGLGTYADFDTVRKLTVPVVGLQTGRIFKNWGYSGGMTLKKALAQSVRLPIPGMSSRQQKRLYAMLTYLWGLDRDVRGRRLTDALQFLAAHTPLSGYFRDDIPSPEGDCFNRLLELAEDAGNDPLRFFSAVALQSDSDAYDARAQRVALMTMHAAKGLEFPVVVIAGCENGLIPFTLGREGTDLDEERRLFYVAMTRAEERLFFSRARKRTIRGRTVEREVSPFVADIEKALIREESAGRGKGRPDGHRQLSLFG